MVAPPSRQRSQPVGPCPQTGPEKDRHPKAAALSGRGWRQWGASGFRLLQQPLCMFLAGKLHKHRFSPRVAAKRHLDKLGVGCIERLDRGFKFVIRGVDTSRHSPPSISHNDFPAFARSHTTSLVATSVSRAGGVAVATAMAGGGATSGVSSRRSASASEAAGARMSMVTVAVLLGRPVASATV
jgi:hypothetical protein